MLRSATIVAVLFSALAGPMDRRRLVWSAALGALWLAIYVGLRRWLGCSPFVAVT